MKQKIITFQSSPRIKPSELASPQHPYMLTLFKRQNSIHNSLCFRLCSMTQQKHLFYVTPLGIIAHYTLIECVLGLCFTFINLLFLLPYEYIGENPVPTVIFKGRPTTFQAFVICVLFAFCTANNAIVSPSLCKFGLFFGYLSMAFMASAFGVLSWALLCSCCA